MINLKINFHLFLPNKFVDLTKKNWTKGNWMWFSTGCLNSVYLQSISSYSGHHSLWKEVVWENYLMKVSFLLCRVLEIMRRDAQKDPNIFPDALHARMLINQVLCQLFIYWFECAVLWYIFYENKVGKLEPSKPCFVFHLSHSKDASRFYMIYRFFCLLGDLPSLVTDNWPNGWRYHLGRQEIGEANSDDISLWCHLHRC